MQESVPQNANITSHEQRAVGTFGLNAFTDETDTSAPVKHASAEPNRMLHADLIFAVLILLLLLTAYWPALRGAFLWDDDCWTTNIIPLLNDLHGLSRIWLEPTALQQYYPLTGTTFWIDYNLWGLWTTPYHVENIFLHGVSVWLFWRLLRHLGVPGAWLAALIFALHPQMSESVAWITERKNVLSLVLYLGALLAYGHYCRFWQPGEPDSASEQESACHTNNYSYTIALILFLGAMLSKTTAFSLPPVLLVICWWKRGRLRWREDIVPTLPIFAISIGFSLVTSYLEKNHVGAHGADWYLSFSQRFLVAGRVLWFYVTKLIWPAEFTFVYQRWTPDPSEAWQWLFPIGAISILVLLVVASKRIGRGPAAALMFYAGTLFPVLGFMNVYFMRYSFVSDHWTYLSSLGPIALFGALTTTISQRFGGQNFRLLVSIGMLVVLGTLTWQQSHVYKSSEALWRDTLRKNPGSWMAHINLSKTLAAEGVTVEAESECREAVRLRPNDVDVLYNFANLLAKGGKYDEAISIYRRAVQLNPAEADVHNNLALILYNTHRLDESAHHFREVIRYKPGYPLALYRLGRVLAEQGKREEALKAYLEALRQNPASGEIRAGLRDLGMDAD